MPCFFISLQHYQNKVGYTDIAQHLLYKHGQCPEMVNVVRQPIVAYLKFQQTFLNVY